VRDATTAAIGDGRGLFQFPRMENGNIRMNANWAGRSDRIFAGAQIGNGEIDYWAKNVKIQKWLGWLKRVKLG
jgi:hypothetical protein